MQRILIDKIKKSIQDWARQSPEIEIVLIHVYPSGIGDNIHIIVVATKGFENWRQFDRQKNLTQFLRNQLGDSVMVNIPVILALTEEQYDKYEITQVD